MDFRSGGFKKRDSQVTLDLTPLIDCIFQLLIFFLLTASFITTPNLAVELPKAAAKVASTQQQDLRITVTREGAIMHAGKRLGPGALLTTLKKLYTERSDARVLIEADTKAYHGKVVQVMDAAKSAGFRRLGVAIKN
ncbi:MAG: biopolymer transporter ExbD [Pseudomonadota bacterium]